MNPEIRMQLRIAVRHFYDVQTIRMQHSGRIAKKAATNQALLSEEQKAMFEVQVKRLTAVEKEALDAVKEILAKIPFYTDVLDTDDPRWRGLGPTLSGVLLAEIDIVRAEKPSSLWKYAGLAPVYAKRCKVCNRIVTAGPTGWVHDKKKANEKKCKYDGKDADPLPPDEVWDSGTRERPMKGVKREYNLFLKTKVLGVLGPNFLKSGNEVYRKVYDGYKHRWETDGRGTSPGHIHNAAMRYMIKMFLLDLWREWRGFEKLPIRPSYQEEKLGHKHAANS